ncbi:hypothetical protein C8F04DRAFT_1293841 [Mycena alexandri]|uniref:Uncharacterized protein n=1 Tax=Mycena alexandri TaxID=1745969 RepID=A0AAD6SGL6_9AGAR|nr:hypothetical protein C8F04DRAFT_1293841 [Mycena alexandri]
MACRRCCRIAQGRALGRTGSELAHKQPDAVSIPLPTSLLSIRATSRLRLVDTGTAHNEDDGEAGGPLVSRTGAYTRTPPPHSLTDVAARCTLRRGVSAAWWERDLEGAYVPSALYLFFFNHVLFPSFVPISHPLLLRPRPRPRVHRRTPAPTPTALSTRCQVAFAQIRRDVAYTAPRHERAPRLPIILVVRGPSVDESKS